MYGKCTTHLIRLSGVIQAINIASEIIENAPNCNKEVLTDEFIVFLKRIDRNSYIEKLSTINSQTINQALILLNYFNANKIILADMDIEINDCDNITLILEEYLEKKMSTQVPKQVLSDKKTYTSKEINTYKKILLMNGPSVKTSEVNKSYRINLEE